MLGSMFYSFLTAGDGSWFGWSPISFRSGAHTQGGLMALDPVSSIVDLVKTGIDKVFPDAGESQKRDIQGFLGALSGQVKVLTAELSGNTLQRSWRPILMLSITAILVNNYILVPYLSLFGVPATVLEFPDELWSLLKIGVGGYVVGRSAEKGIKLWRKD